MAKKKRTGKKSKSVKKTIVQTPWWKDKKIRFILLGLALVTFITFYPSLNNDFTNWDDQDYVTESPFVAKLSMESIKTMFTTPIASNYHPLTILSLAINYKMAVVDAPVYHWTNLLLHILNTILVFFFVYRFSGKKWEGATVVALLFAIHPMHVESVAWIAERKDVLYTAFFLAGLIKYLDYLDDRKTKKLVYTGIFFLLSLFSKPTAVVFPLALILIDFVKGRKIDAKSLIEKIPFFVLSIIFGLITIKIQSGSAIGDIEDYSLIKRIMFASYGVWIYFAKLFVPFKLATFHPYPPAGAFPLIFKIAPLLAAGLVGIVIWSLKYTRIIAFGFAFYLISIALTLQFVQVGSAIISERYTYVSYIGLFMILGAFLDWVLSDKSDRARKIKPVLIGILAIYSLVFAFMSFQQSKVWANSGTLWNNVIRHYPEAAIPHNNLGNYLMDQKKYDEALQKLNRAIELNDNYYKAYIARGQLYRRMQQYDLALKDYNKAIEMHREFHDAYNNRGNIYFSLNQDDEALADYNKVLSIEPSDSKAYGNSGAIYARKAQYDKAMEFLNKALSLNPNYPDAYLNRGVVNAQTGNTQAAVNDFSMNLRLAGDNSIIYYYRGLEYHKIGQYQNALNDFNLAIQMEPNRAVFYGGRAATHLAMGNQAAAQQDQARASQ